MENAISACFGGLSVELCIFSDDGIYLDGNVIYAKLEVNWMFVFIVEQASQVLLSLCLKATFVLLLFSQQGVLTPSLPPLIAH